MTAEIEQEGAHVRRRLHQHDEEGFGVEDGHDRQAASELDHGGIEIATSTRVAELRHMLDRGGQQCGDTFGIHAIRDARIDGQPVAAHHDYRVDAAGAAERFHHVADGRHTRGNVGFREVEVKH